MEMPESFVGRDATGGSGAGDGDKGSRQRAQEMKSRGGNLQIESAAYAEEVGIDSRNTRAYLDELNRESREDAVAAQRDIGEAYRQKKAWVKKHMGVRREVDQVRHCCPKCDWVRRYNEPVCGKCGAGLDGSVRVRRWVGGDWNFDVEELGASTRQAMEDARECQRVV
jgi:hypothetical protein